MTGRELDDYLAVPYVLRLDSLRHDNGRWMRHASYPELGCEALDETPEGALDRLDEMRITVIRERLDAGLDVPMPRPPLRDLLPR